MANVKETETSKALGLKMDQFMAKACTAAVEIIELVISTRDDVRN